MSLAKQLPLADRWHFLQHPEADFFNIAKVINSLPWDNLMSNKKAAGELRSFIAAHTGSLLGTLVDVKASLSIAGDSDVKILDPSSAEYPELEGTGTVIDVCMMPELVVDEAANNEILVSDQTDLYLGVVAWNHSIGTGQQFWIPSQHIEELVFHGFSTRGLN